MEIIFFVVIGIVILIMIKPKNKVNAKMESLLRSRIRIWTDGVESKSIPVLMFVDGLSSKSSKEAAKILIAKVLGELIQEFNLSQQYFSEKAYSDIVNEEFPELIQAINEFKEDPKY